MCGMATTEEIRLANLALLIKEHGGQRPLADKIKKSPAQISQWVTRAPDSQSGKPRTISGMSARKIEELTGKPVGWMDIEHDASPPPGNVAPAYPTGYRRLPVVSWVSAGGWGSAADPFMPGDADEWKETFRKVGDSAFMLRVRGDSMTNPHGSPSAPEGSLIVVDPSVRAENGSLVVAKLDNSEEATFKKLVIDSGQHYLKALNPDYKPIQVNGNCRIIGVVVQIVQEL